VLNLIFLTVADVASGVVATTTIIDRQQGVIFDEIVILSVSIVTSLRELWNAGSQALAVFICITSLLLPYFKLILMMVAWVAPMKTSKGRERFIQILDAISKWSFV
jgi:Paraquat-inducible protein A